MKLTKSFSIIYRVEPIIERLCPGQPFKRRHIFAGNRVSTQESVTFDPSRIQGQKLKGLGNDIYWYSLGWLSMPWGYRRRQPYLDR